MMEEAQGEVPERSLSPDQQVMEQTAMEMEEDGANTFSAAAMGNICETLLQNIGGTLAVEFINKQSHVTQDIRTTTRTTWEASIEHVLDQPVDTETQNRAMVALVKAVIYDRLNICKCFIFEIIITLLIITELFRQTGM